MSEGAPTGPAADPGPTPDPGPPTVRPARKRFIAVGLAIGVAIIVLIGLFTSSGGEGSGGSGSGSSAASGAQPQAGDTVPAFTAQNVGPVGGARVAVTDDGGGSGRPAVLLFFGNWCPSCHQELPPLAAAVRQQDETQGVLSHIRVIGIDSEDSPSSARSFIKSAGVLFPVAYDPDVSITEGLFDFHGDPYAVFVKGDGTVSKVVAGAVLTPATFTADEQALTPNGT